jgi:hypothetical protein
VVALAVKTIAVSELRRKLKRILACLENSGEPYFITQSGRLKAVLAQYEEQTVSEWLLTRHTCQPVVQV